MHRGWPNKVFWATSPTGLHLQYLRQASTPRWRAAGAVRPRSGGASGADQPRRDPAAHLGRAGPRTSTPVSARRLRSLGPGRRPHRGRQEDVAAATLDYVTLRPNKAGDHRRDRAAHRQELGPELGRSCSTPSSSRPGGHHPAKRLDVRGAGRSGPNASGCRRSRATSSGSRPVPPSRRSGPARELLARARSHDARPTTAADYVLDIIVASVCAGDLGPPPSWASPTGSRPS